MQDTFIITDANGGLGANLVSHFLQSHYAEDYKAISAVRNPASADTLKKILAESLNANDHGIIAVDLSSLASVRTAAKDLNQRVASSSISHIRALVLNAALQHTQGMKSANDGLEANFAVNYLSNFLFTHLLLQSMDPAMGRVVIIMQSTKQSFQKIQALGKPPGKDAEGDDYKAGMRRYGTKYSDISVLAVDPGAIRATGLFKESPAALQFVLHGVMAPLAVVTTALLADGNFRTLKKSAKDLLYASFDESLVKI